MTGFRCSHCHRVCCWDCLEPDDSIDEIKTIGSRYCNTPECLAAERAACNCTACRNGGPGHMKATGEPCQHRGPRFGPAFTIAVEEHPSITFEGPPMRGTCPTCGTDLDEQRRLGKVGHACFGPDDVTNYDPPS